MKIMKHSLMSLSPRRRPSAKGFTLIEILVVIAIATILAAMLFAGFSRVKEKGRSAVCQNNLKQIALGMQQYVQDNDGRYPQEEGETWTHKVFPYIKSIEVFQCPTASRPLSEIVGGEDPLGILTCVYRYNWIRLNKFVSSSNSLRLHGHSEAASNLSNYSTTTYLNVCDPPRLYKEDDAEEKITASCGRTMLVGYDVRHHSGGTNWSFLDGHVKWLTPEQLAELSCTNPVAENASEAP